MSVPLATDNDFHYNLGMYEWRFRVTPGMIPLSFLEAAYFAGWGRVPRMTQMSIQDNELRVRSDSFGSGTVHVPMFHLPLGVVMESTETLLERREPYLLVRELARGALGRFYRRLFDWQMLGFQHPAPLSDRLRDLARHFASLIVKDPFESECEGDFVSFLDELAPLIVDENKECAEQSLSWRTRNNERLPIVLGIGMNAPRIETLHEFDFYAKLLHNSFHAMLPMPTWRELEPQPGQFDWERLESRLVNPARFDFQIVLGPLLSFSAERIPDWLLQNLTEEGVFESRAAQFVNAVAERYGHLAHSWILANQFTNPSLSELSSERSVTLIRMLARQLRSRGIGAPIMVGIGQLWGEYASQRTPDWEQIQFAEALMGCREIDTFLLEIHFGCGEHSMLPRDPMNVGHMIDQWSFLGKKIYVSFSLPSAGNAFATIPELPQGMQWSEEKQRAWTEALLLAFLGKRAVKGIFWSCLQDQSVPQESASVCNHGLINVQQAVKPAFKHFTAARKNLLQ